MSLNLNVVHLAGNLTRDPQVRHLADDKSVTGFGIAINRKWKDKAGVAHEEATFVDVTAWGNTGELAARFLRKGSGVYVEGRLKLDQWEKDGVKHSRLQVIAEKLQFTSPKPADQATTATTAPTTSAPTKPASADDEPPF